jgi:hypothetical protein
MLQSSSKWEILMSKKTGTGATTGANNRFYMRTVSSLLLEL